MPPDPLSDDLLSRPRIRIDGTDAEALSSGLLSLTISEDTTGLFRCHATFGNWGTASGSVGYLYFDRQLVDYGKDMQVVLGNHTLFEGRIFALNGGFPDGQPPVIGVAADDRLQDLRMTRRTRTFEDTTIADVINRFASDHGLQASVDLSGPTHKILAQLDQSDLAFLREQCRHAGAEIWVEGMTLHASDRLRRNAGTVTLRHGEDLRELTVSADLTNQCTRLTVSGWSVSEKQSVSFDASNSTLSAEVSGHDTGATILDAAFGARPIRVAEVNVPSTADAQHRAQSVFRASARRFVVARGVSTGSRPLRVGTHVTLDGVGGLFNGEYYVADICHRFDGESGFRTEFTAERAWLGHSDR